VNGRVVAFSQGKPTLLEALDGRAISRDDGEIITRDTDDEIAIFYLTDPEDVPVGSIQSRHR
jgi:hypothetical protein